MRYAHLAFSLTLLTSAPVLAQAPLCNWMDSKVIPSTNALTTYGDYMHAVTASDPNGGVLAVWGGVNTRITKYAADGSVEFQHGFTGNSNVRCLRLASDGSYYGLGTYKDSVRANEALVLVSGTYWEHAFIFKLDPLGQAEWAIDLNVGELWSGGGANGLALSPEGDVYAGFIKNSQGCIMRFSEDGTVLSQIDQSAHLINSMDVDGSGNIWVAGACVFPPTTTFGGVQYPVPSAGNGYNRYLVRYRPDGTPTFARFGSDVSCTISQVGCVDAGRAYWAGNLISDAVFGDLSVEGPALWGIPAAFIAMVDSTGEFEFLKQTPLTPTTGVGVGYQNFMDVDAEGNLILLGRARGTALWEDGTTTANSQYGNNLTMMAYAPDGAFQWAKAVDDPEGWASIFGHSISAAPDGTIHLTGMAKGLFAIDDQQAQHPEEALEFFMFVAQLGAPLSTGVNEASTTAPVSVFPNPAQDMLHLRTSSPIENLSCFNTMGQQMQVVLRGDQLDVSALPDGLHVLHVRTGAGHHVVRFIKQAV